MMRRPATPVGSPTMETPRLSGVQMHSPFSERSGDDSKPTHQRFQHLLTWTALSIVFIAVGVYITVTASNNIQNDARGDARQFIQTARSSMDGLLVGLSRVPYTVRGTIRNQRQLLAQPNLTTIKEIFTDVMGAQQTVVASLQLALDGIISVIVPLEGNEVALGIDLLNLTASEANVRQSAVRRNLLEQNTTAWVEGPILLTQGIVAVLFRYPVYNVNGSGISILSMIVSSDRLFGSLDENFVANPSFFYSVSRTDGGAVFAGRSVLTNSADELLDPVCEESDVNLVEASLSFKFCAVPSNGWPDQDLSVTLGVFVTILLTALIVAVLARVTHRYHEVRSMADSALQSKERAARIQAECDAAQRTLAIQSNFWRIISHELRTPLNAIGPVVSALESQTLTASSRSMLKQLEFNAMRLSVSVDELLDFNEIPLPNGISRFRMQDLVNEALDSLDFGADEGIDVVVNVSSVESISGEASTVRKFLHHILWLTLQHMMGTTGVVHIIIECDSDRLSIRADVPSTRPAFSNLFTNQEQDLEQLNVRGRTEQGLGLSLHLAQAIAKSMNGSVTVRFKPQSHELELHASIDTKQASEDQAPQAVMFPMHLTTSVDLNKLELPSHCCIVGSASPYIDAVMREMSDAGVECKHLLTSEELCEFIADFRTDKAMFTKERQSLVCVFHRQNYRPGMLFDGLCECKEMERVHMHHCCVCPDRETEASPSPTELIPVLLTSTSSWWTDGGLSQTPQLPRCLSSHRVRCFLHDALTVLRPEVRRETRLQLHVLVVDDVLMNRLVLQQILEHLGHTCDVASGGKQALEMVQSRSYDACCMDIFMPEMDGIEATAAIRELFPHLPIIGVTASSSPKDHRAGLAAGMSFLMEKPVVSKQLQRVLVRLCDAGRRSSMV